MVFVQQQRHLPDEAAAARQLAAVQLQSADSASLELPRPTIFIHENHILTLDKAHHLRPEIRQKKAKAPALDSFSNSASTQDGFLVGQDDPHTVYFIVSAVYRSDSPPA